MTVSPMASCLHPMSLAIFPRSATVRANEQGLRICIRMLKCVPRMMRRFTIAQWITLVRP